MGSKGDRKRRAVSSDSGSNSDSSDSDGAREHRKARNHRRETESRRSPSRWRGDKKKRSHKSERSEEKKAKAEKKKRKKRHHCREEEPEAARGVDYPRAMGVVRELLGEFPEIASDLLALLQMLDEGEVAVIGGLENRRLREPKGAYAKSKEAAGEPLLEVMQRLLADSDARDRDAQTQPSSEPSTAPQSLEEGSDKTVSALGSSHAPRPPDDDGDSQRATVIGPSMPPPGTLSARASEDEDEDEDDEVVGPALPGMRGFRLADERVEAEMARQAKALEQEQWDRARGVHAASEPPRTTSLVREEWMTVMPDSSLLKESLGPTPQRQTGKPAAFRSKEPAAVDKTWFDSPEERERAKRAKLDIQLLGYIREENAPAIGPSAPRVVAAGPSVHESIMPSANPEADSSIRRQMEQLKQSRGPSLMEQHQRKVAEDAKTQGDAAKSKAAGWNRERDLTSRRGMSSDEADRIIRASKQVNAKFTAPTITRQFL